jgi:hypothetical protein
VRERALEVHDVALGQALGLGVERAQERVQVLLRAAEASVLEAVGVRPVERAHVGVELEQAALGSAGRRGARREPRRPRRRVRRSRARATRAGQRGRALGVASARSAMRSPSLGRARSLDRVDEHQRLARGTWALADASTSRTAPWTVAVSELSIFMLSVTATTSPGVDLVAAETGIADHDAGRVAADHAALVARDPVRDAVDLDQQVGVLHRGHRAVRAPAEAEPALVRGQLLDGRLDAGIVDLEQEPPRRVWQTSKR